MPNRILMQYCIVLWLLLLLFIVIVILFLSSGHGNIFSVRHKAKSLCSEPLRCFLSHIFIRVSAKPLRLHIEHLGVQTCFGVTGTTGTVHF